MRMPGTVVAIAENSPRTSAGALGFGSNVSRWDGPPSRKKMIQDFPNLAVGREDGELLAELFCRRQLRVMAPKPIPLCFNNSRRERCAFFGMNVSLGQITKAGIKSA